MAAQDIDDDVDWEEWMSMTDAQQEAALDRELKAYAEMLEEMSADEYYAHKRHFIMRTINGARANARKSPGLIADTLMQFVIRPSQKSLLGLRIWRRTGQWPAEA